MTVAHTPSGARFQCQEGISWPKFGVVGAKCRRKRLKYDFSGPAPSQSRPLGKSPSAGAGVTFLAAAAVNHPFVGPPREPAWRDRANAMPGGGHAGAGRASPPAICALAVLTAGGAPKCERMVARRLRSGNPLHAPVPTSSKGLASGPCSRLPEGRRWTTGNSDG